MVDCCCWFSGVSAIPNGLDKGNPKGEEGKKSVLTGVGGRE